MNYFTVSPLFSKASQIVAYVKIACKHRQSMPLPINSENIPDFPKTNSTLYRDRNCLITVDNSGRVIREIDRSPGHHNSRRCTYYYAIFFLISHCQVPTSHSFSLDYTQPFNILIIFASPKQAQRHDIPFGSAWAAAIRPKRE